MKDEELNVSVSWWRKPARQVCSSFTWGELELWARPIDLLFFFFKSCLFFSPLNGVSRPLADLSLVSDWNSCHIPQVCSGSSANRRAGHVTVWQVWLHVCVRGRWGAWGCFKEKLQFDDVWMSHCVCVWVCVCVCVCVCVTAAVIDTHTLNISVHTPDKNGWIIHIKYSMVSLPEITIATSAAARHPPKTSHFEWWTRLYFTILQSCTMAPLQVLSSQ